MMAGPFLVGLGREHRRDIINRVDICIRFATKCALSFKPLDPIERVQARLNGRALARLLEYDVYSASTSTWLSADRAATEALDVHAPRP
jgi:hypothetical protein